MTTQHAPHSVQSVSNHGGYAELAPDVAQPSIQGSLLQEFISLQPTPAAQLDMWNRIIRYVRTNRWAAPFNVAMAYIQRPEAGPCLTAQRWAQLGRRIAPDATPLIIMWTRGPAAAVFEYRDTMPMPGEEDIAVDLDAIFMKAYPTRSIDGLAQHLMDMGRYVGIRAEDRDYGRGLAGRARRMAVGDLPSVMSERAGRRKEHKQMFLVTVAKRASEAERVKTLLHEFAHVLLGHCGPLNVEPERDWTGHKWARVKLSHAAKEFEAEHAAQIVGRWLGIVDRSEDYIKLHTGGASSEGELPYGAQMDKVLTVANRLWGLVHGEKRWEKALTFDAPQRPNLASLPVGEPRGSNSDQQPRPESQLEVQAETQPEHQLAYRPELTEAGQLPLFRSA